MLRKNKKSMSLSLVFLVLATLILTSSALVIFYLRTKNISEEVRSVGFLSGIYAKEEMINSYVVMAMENAIEGSKNPDFSQYDFEINFLAELSEYKLIDDPVILELEEIMQQIDGIHIQYDDAKKTVTFEYQVLLEDELVFKENGQDKKLFDVDYSYSNKIEKSVV